MVTALSHFIAIFFLLPLVVAKQDGQTVVASVREEGSVMAGCVRAGLEVRYRFSFRVCSRRRGWFDPCKNKRDDIRSIEYDPISRQYMIQKDRLGDGSSPSILRTESEKSALAAAQSTDPFSLDFLAYGDQEFLNQSGLYLEVRSRGYCKSDDTDLENIVDTLTFGVFEANRFDTGWESFDLKTPK